MRVIGHALDRGVNYYDTSYLSHEGNSETVLGKALRGHRDQVKTGQSSSPCRLSERAVCFHLERGIASQRNGARRVKKPQC